jgi:hypothetical protein
MKYPSRTIGERMLKCYHSRGGPSRESLIPRSTNVEASPARLAIVHSYAYNTINPI